MNTKIIFTRNSPVRTVLVNGSTGQELYRIDTPRRFVGSVTRVFRCDPARPPVPNLMPRLRWSTGAPYEDYDPKEWRPLARAQSDRRREDKEGDDEVTPTADDVPGEDSPLVENEIARLYWRWFASTRIVFEGKIRTRAQLMPLKSKLKRLVDICYELQRNSDPDPRYQRAQELYVQAQRRHVPMVSEGIPIS